MLSQSQDRIYRSLTPEEWKEIDSPYIHSGYKEDCFEIIHLEFNNSEVVTTCKMTNYALSETDEAGFHLSIFTAMAILAQQCIVHAHVINNVWRKDYEALLQNFSMELKRPIRTPEEISVKMTITDENMKPSRSQKDLIRAAYTWIYDIEQGAFTGQLKAYFTFRADELRFPD